MKRIVAGARSVKRSSGHGPAPALQVEEVVVDTAGRVNIIDLPAPTIKHNCITNTAWGAAGKPKILSYDTDRLSRVSALATLFTTGSVFRLDVSLLYTSLALAAVAGATFGLILTFVEDTKDFDATKMHNITKLVANFVPFLLGLYVSITLTRWWAMRSKVDDIVNATSNLCSIFTSFCSQQRYYLRFQKVLKYSVASVTCLAKDARESDDLDALLHNKLLDENELAVLYGTHRTARAQVLWSWVASLAVDGLRQAQVPAGLQNAALAQCQRASDALLSIQTYRKTQLPFPYVHMITLLVNTHNLFVALRTGVDVALSWREDKVTDVALDTVFLFIIPLLYQGLLAICAFIQDPFGEDLIDLPILAIQRELGDGCDAVFSSHRHLRGTRKYFAKREAEASASAA